MDLNNFNYNIYWKKRNVEVRSKLMAREVIFARWIEKNSRVLDVAVGNSFLPTFLKKEKNAEVMAFDISPVVVEKQGAKGVNSFVVDITAPEFKIANYDYIILSEILEHLVLPEKLLNRVRNSAPYLLISIPNSAFYKHRISLLFGSFFKQWAVHPAEHLRYWSHRDFLEWLEVLDLKVIKYKASNNRPWPNLLGNQICYLVKT